MSLTFKRSYISDPSWALFFLFVAVNAFLTYSAFGPVFKLWILFFGLILPFCLALYLSPKASISEKPIYFQELFTASGWLPWFFVIIPAILFRFYRIPHFFNYPVTDEFTNAYYAIHLVQKWDWFPFFHFSQLPPLYIWILAGLYKIFGVTLWPLWLLPAVLSFLSVPLAYAAARGYFSKSFSFLCFLLAALTLWPLYLGRFSHQVNLMMAWEYAALVFLGFFVKSDRREIWALILGIWVGLGFYTYFSWALLALVIGILVALADFSKERSFRSFSLFILANLLSVAPLLVIGLRKGYGGYISGLLITHQSGKGLEWEPLELFYYFKIFLWGTWRKYFSYGPWGAGFLNAVLGGFFLVGVLELARFYRHALPRWIAFIFLILFTPMLLANIFNALRLAYLLPLFLIVIAVGISFLFKRTPSALRFPLFALLVFLSCGIDFLTLEKTRLYVNRTYPTQKTEEKVRAYQILENIHQESGPGLVFGDWDSDFWDVSLSVVTYPFNALVNQRIPVASASWAAIYSTSWLKPYLLEQWPHAHWYNLDWDKEPVFHNFDLAVVPISDFGSNLSRWIQAETAIQKADYLFVNSPRKYPRREVAHFFLGQYSLFQKDPLLQYIFCEKYSSYCVHDSECVALIQEALSLKPLSRDAGSCLWQGLAVHYDEDEGNDSLALAAISKAIQDGKPHGFWYYQWGSLLVRAHRYGEARAALIRAGELNPLLEPPKEILLNLDRLAAESKRDLLKKGKD